MWLSLIHIFFTFVAGCTASVVRACVMLLLVMLAPLLRREADGLTSLCAGLLILLIANPLSIAAAGLQLSFAAMAGIILLTPRVYARLDALFRRGDKKRRPNAALSFVMASLSSSVGSVSYTHLDVYKRQDERKKLGQDGEDIDQFCAQESAQDGKDIDIHGVVAL